MPTKASPDSSNDNLEEKMISTLKHSLREFLSRGELTLTARKCCDAIHWSLVVHTRNIR